MFVCCDEDSKDVSQIHDREPLFKIEQREIILILIAIASNIFCKRKLFLTHFTYLLIKYFYFSMTKCVIVSRCILNELEKMPTEYEFYLRVNIREGVLFRRNYPRVSRVTVYTRDNKEKDRSAAHNVSPHILRSFRKTQIHRPGISLCLYLTRVRDLRRSCITLAAPRSRSASQSSFN